MPSVKDGPASRCFASIALKGSAAWSKLSSMGVSKEMAEASAHAPTGKCVSWGIPFDVKRPLVVRTEPVSVKLDPVKAQWLVFMHALDVKPLTPNKDGFFSPMPGLGRLGERAGEYAIEYADGTSERIAIRARREIREFFPWWGYSAFEAVPHIKHRPARSGPTQVNLNERWGNVQTRVDDADMEPWTNWLWAWQNPHPRKAITRIRIEPADSTIVLSGLSAGKASEHPLRWRSRRKAVLTLPKGAKLDPDVDECGLLSQIQLDMGQVISAITRPVYPNEKWSRTYDNRLPEICDREALIEYTSHPDAQFHFPNGKTVPVARLEDNGEAGRLRVVTPATQRVRLSVVEKSTRRAVPVKLHVHGEAGEYLAPVDRHRIPNPIWFQDYSADFAHADVHWCTYIDGETTIDLPLGRVYVEVAKGFEIKPVRKVVRVGRRTRRISIEIAGVLPWREKGWVSADTHVHFLSPKTALLEGQAEGVNVVNLLASQWGELVTNVGDFDGRTTFGSTEAGGDGEFLVRVGTENRQHVLGHISLLGYEGDIIAPMTTGGPAESAIGDPVEILLTEWAARCKEQNGVVILPHSPNPRAEGAAAIVTGGVDGTEMLAGQFLYAGISPYSLSDYYRYLNCGYMIAIVGGTDKMRANTPVGGMRTYARLRDGEPFTYDAWKEAIRRAQTFVTCGPLLEFSVDGHAPGARITMTRSGGTVDVHWNAASVTMPMSRVELVVNGEIREGRAVRGGADKGHWSVHLDRSSWLALLVRGHYPDKPEIITAHSTPVMVQVARSPFMSAADAMTILEQIEGAMAYLDTIGTRAEAKARKRMKLVLTAAHRDLHNRMHQAGHFHNHTPAGDHAEHH